MAKGRKLTTSRSERLLGSYNSSQFNGTAIGTDVTELDEEDLWSIVNDIADREEEAVRNEWNSRDDSSGRISIRSRRRSAGVNNHMNGLSLAFDESDKTSSSRIVHQFGFASPRAHSNHRMATSVPVNVPDWSKILRFNSVESLPDSDDGFEDCESEKIPPHEYLACSRSKATTSVFEGVGRTLKGRDMRRVRDAVWSQTGFDG